MNIREATDTDIPQIVSLLKLSLGESLLPKSEEYWRWKHINNPFGRSPVLVAEKDGQLIGVRAFMPWDWRNKDKIYRSLRAVDTATHPDHQGKGIFKKLTLQLVEKCKDEGYDFIFNTPNGKSMPGYLKMGWQREGRLSIRIIPVRPMDILFPSKVTEGGSVTNNSKTDLTDEFLHEYRSSKTKASTITNYSVSYFKWRYLDVPGQEYFWNYSEENGWYAFYRIKISGRRKELRVCDLVTKANVKGKILSRFLRSECKRLNMNIISTCNFGLPASDFGLQLKVGPEITFRNLNMNNTPPNWSPSIGDVELF